MDHWEKLQKLSDTHNQVHVDVRRSYFIRKNRTVAQLESAYRRIEAKVLAIHDATVKSVIEQILANGGKAHAKVSHKYEGDIDPWWLYTVENSKLFHCVTFSEEWVKTPENPINLELGQALYDNDRIVRELFQKVCVAREIFKQRIESWCYKHLPKVPGEILKITINDRIYWYHASCNRYGVLMWESTFWPGTKIIEKEFK